MYDQNAQGDPLTELNSSQNIFSSPFFQHNFHSKDVIDMTSSWLLRNIQNRNQLLTFNANGTRQNFVFLSCIGRHVNLGSCDQRSPDRKVTCHLAYTLISLIKNYQIVNTGTIMVKQYQNSQ